MLTYGLDAMVVCVCVCVSCIHLNVHVCSSNRVFACLMKMNVFQSAWLTAAWRAVFWSFQHVAIWLWGHGNPPAAASHTGRDALPTTFSWELSLVCQHTSHTPLFVSLHITHIFHFLPSHVNPPYSCYHSSCSHCSLFSCQWRNEVGQTWPSSSVNHTLLM